MANSMTMEELLASQETKKLTVSRGQQVEGEVIAQTEGEFVLDLGVKSEGVLSKRDLTPDQIANINVGDNLTCFVQFNENDAGQVVLALQRTSKNVTNIGKWNRLREIKEKDETITGRGVEVNRGGLVVETSSLRGFLPASQAGIKYASSLENLIDQQIELKVLEVDPEQNRLIFSQKIQVSDETKQKLEKYKAGETVKGVVGGILPFGLFIKLEDEVDGLVHISEVAWEKSDNVLADYGAGQEVEAKVIGVDSENGRVNLSIRGLKSDPFADLSEKYQSDDVVKGTIVKSSPQGVIVALADGVEGVIPSENMEAGKEYKEGESITVLIDKVDTAKRKLVLAPFLTSTSGLIYK